MIQTKQPKLKMLCFSFPFKKLEQPEFSTVRMHDKSYQVGDLVYVRGPIGILGKAEIVYRNIKKLVDVPTEFLLTDCETTSRDAAIKILQNFYPNLNETHEIVILRAKYLHR